MNLTITIRIKFQVNIFWGPPEAPVKLSESSLISLAICTENSLKSV